MSDIDVVSQTQIIQVEFDQQTIIVDPVTDQVIVVTAPATSVSVTNAGPPGPPGIPGLDGEDAVAFEYTQPTPSSLWHVVHNLGHIPPSVLVIDSGGTVIDGEVVYIDSNTLNILFDVPPFSGTAYIT